MPVIDVTVSIVNTNNRQLLEQCLLSLEQTTQGLSMEVIVIDNASTDGSVEMIRTRFPHVEVIVNPERYGYSRCHNQALRHSQGSYVCICNEDLLFYPGALQKMVAFMDQHPHVGAVGPLLIYEDGQVQPECARRFPNLWTEFCEHAGLAKHFPRSKLLADAKMRYWDHRDTRPVDCLSGACMMVRRETLQDVGLMDERFFMYCEDVDWPYRMKKHGWEVCFLPEAKVLHYRDRTNRRLVGQMRIEVFRSQYLYFRKHCGLLYAGVYRMLMAVLAGAKVLFYTARQWIASNVEEQTGYRDKTRTHYEVLRWLLTNRC